MARAACRLSVIFCVLVCLSPVGATPITLAEFQKDDSIVQAMKWDLLVQIQEMSRPLEIEKWQRVKTETGANSSATTVSRMTIPESQSLVLLGIGLAGIAVLMKKKSRKLR